MFRNQQECVPIGKLTSDSVVKNPPADARDSGDVGLIPWVGKIPWRRIWQPPPVFLPGESHGQRSLAGCCPWSCRISVSQWAEDGGRGAAGPGRRGRSLLWQRRGRWRADTRGHTACPGLPLLSAQGASQERASVLIMQRSGTCAPHSGGTPSLQLLNRAP